MVIDFVCVWGGRSLQNIFLREKSKLQNYKETSLYYNREIQPILSKYCIVLDMVTHFSSLAWKIPWTEEPGGIHSMGPQRVRHDWTHTPMHTHTPQYNLVFFFLSHCLFVHSPLVVCFQAFTIINNFAMDIVYALLYTSARLSQRYGNRELLCQIMGYFKYILSNCHKNERLIS